MRAAQCHYPVVNNAFSFPVLVLFKQTGDAPILKQPKVWVRSPSQTPTITPQPPQVNGHDQFAKIVKYLRTKLQREQVVCACIQTVLSPSPFPLQFVYLREAFTPSLEEQVDTLYQVHSPILPLHSGRAPSTRLHRPTASTAVS